MMTKKKSGHGSPYSIIRDFVPTNKSIGEMNTIARNVFASMHFFKQSVFENRDVQTLLVSLCGAYEFKFAFESYKFVSNTCYQQVSILLF